MTPYLNFYGVVGDAVSISKDRLAAARLPVEQDVLTALDGLSVVTRRSGPKLRSQYREDPVRTSLRNSVHKWVSSNQMKPLPECQLSKLDACRRRALAVLQVSSGEANARLFQRSQTRCASWATLYRAQLTKRAPKCH